jgi:hypothetical protein
MAHAPELGLWKGAGVRMQPRDRHGRFVRVVLTPQRRLILQTARKMRDQMGLQDDPRFRILDRVGDA